MPTETTVRFTIELPASTVDHYEAQAHAANKSVEELLHLRLGRCSTHDAQRPLYFTDIEREEVEQILGEGYLNTPGDVLRQLRNRYTVNIGGTKVRLEEGLYQILKERSQETHEPMRDMVLRACLNGLKDEAWGAH